MHKPYKGTRGLALFPTAQNRDKAVARGNFYGNIELRTADEKKRQQEKKR